jgi:hypothetical protein
MNGCITSRIEKKDHRRLFCFAFLVVSVVFSPSAEAQCSQSWLQRESQAIDTISQSLGAAIDREAPSVSRRMIASKQAQQKSSEKGNRLTTRFITLWNESGIISERLSRLDPSLINRLQQRQPTLISAMKNCQPPTCDAATAREYQIRFNRSVSDLMRQRYPEISATLDRKTDQMEETHNGLIIWNREWKSHDTNYHQIQSELRRISPDLARRWDNLDLRVKAFVACQKQLHGY